MKVPVQLLLRLLPLGSSLAAAISLTAVYGLLSLVGYAYFAVWAYAPYLDSALGAGGKFLGFLLRCIFLVNSGINVLAASTVFIAAGMSACTCGQAAVLGDWFKNAAAARALPLQRARPRLLPALCRLMALPVLVFGPGLGVPAAVLLYGVRTPSAVRTALRLRKWCAWGTLACLIVLSALALLALALAAAHRRRLRRQPGGAGAGWAASPVLHVAPTLASLLLIEVSGAARVRALYQPTVTTNDQLYYTLIVLPELLQQLAAAVPTLLHRCGLAEAYAQRGWRSCTWGWVARAFPAANAAPLEAGGAQEAAPAAGKGDVDCGSSAGGAPSSAGSLKGSGRGGAPPA